MCSASILSHLDLLRKHKNNTKDKDRDPNKSKHLVVINDHLRGAKVSEKKPEIMLATAIACHASFSCIDHTHDVIKKYGTGSTWEKSRMHRTKCTALIKHIITPKMKVELKKTIQGNKFSLMVGESTDCSSSKVMVMTVRNYNSRCKTILDKYLGIIDVISCTGEA